MSVKNRTYCVLIMLLLMFGPISVFADNLAVERVNFDLTPALIDYDYGTELGVRGDLAIPLAPVLGMEIYVGTGYLSADDNYTDYVDTYVGGKLFIGNHEYGRVGVDVSIGDTEYDTDYFGDISEESKTIAFFGELYMSDVTLGVELSQNESTVVDNGYEYDYPDRDVSLFEVTYYPTENVSLGAGLAGKDADGYYVWFETQAGSMISFFAEYLRNKETDENAFGLGVTIYFGGGNTLKENDRHY